MGQSPGAGMPDLGLTGHTLCGALSSFTPAQLPLPLGLGDGSWGAYRVSSWSWGALGLAILALLTLWTQKQL